MASMVKARARRDRAKAVGQLGAEHTVHIAGAVRQAQLIARDRLGLDQAQRQAQLQSRLHHLPRLAGTGRIALRIGHHAGRVKNRDGHVCAPNGLKSPWDVQGGVSGGETVAFRGKSFVLSTIKMGGQTRHL
jgi:hypothetical protein